MYLHDMHTLLLEEIDGRTFRPLLLEMTANHAAFAAYATWRGMAEVLTDGGLSPAAEDTLLRPVVAAYAATRDQRWATILTALCFRWLAASCARRATWCDDTWDVWQELVAAFLDACTRPGPCDGDAPLRPLVVNVVTSRVGLFCKHRWHIQSRECRTDPAQFPPTIDPQGVPWRVNLRRDLSEIQELGAAHYRRFQGDGIIDADDVAILIRTRLQGLTLDEAATALGISMACAKKRRQRAEQAMGDEDPTARLERLAGGEQ